MNSSKISLVKRQIYKLKSNVTLMKQIPLATKSLRYKDTQSKENQ